MRRARGYRAGILLVALAFLASCDIFQGPQGETGATGATGAAGEAGADGVNATSPSFVFTPGGAISYAVVYGGDTVACVGSSYAASRVAQAEWSSAEIGSTCSAAAYGNGIFVAVGASGYIVYCTDGSAWATAADSGTLSSYDLVDVAYGAGRFVAIGNDGSAAGDIIYSADGNDWTLAVDGGAALFNSVDFVNDRFIVGQYYSSGAEKDFYTSVDGSTWTTIDAVAGFVENVAGAAYGNGYYLILGTSGTLLRSADGESWAALDSFDPTETFSAIAYDGEEFFLLKADGSLFSTVDGDSWSFYADLPTSYSYGDMVWASDFEGGVFVVARQ